MTYRAIFLDYRIIISRELDRSPKDRSYMTTWANMTFVK